MSAVYLKEDAAFVSSYLNSEEVALFNQLPTFEKKHSVIVAKKMLELALYNPELDPRKLAKLGLLHDIGKVLERSGIVTKSILVIVRFLFPWLYNWLAELGVRNRLFRAFFIHRHHGLVGAQLLAKIGVSSEFLMMIKKHDPRVEPFAPDDPIELKILQQADSTY
ncbi:MAG: HD domain-containing protein [Candidatus Margulisbacteria bacterium]|jgi:putative nucleotidyltransferase with HDIG domain|nr:HD domain-containing protein [Candidatus Margulisiibacteriota bacterium]